LIVCPTQLGIEIDSNYVHNCFEKSPAWWWPLHTWFIPQWSREFEVLMAQSK